MANGVLRCELQRPGRGGSLETFGEVVIVLDQSDGSRAGIR